MMLSFWKVELIFKVLIQTEFPRITISVLSFPSFTFPHSRSLQIPSWPALFGTPVSPTPCQGLTVFAPSAGISSVPNTLPSAKWRGARATTGKPLALGPLALPGANSKLASLLGLHALAGATHQFPRIPSARLPSTTLLGICGHRVGCSCPMLVGRCQNNWLPTALG